MAGWRLREQWELRRRRRQGQPRSLVTPSGALSTGVLMRSLKIQAEIAGLKKKKETLTLVETDGTDK